MINIGSYCTLPLWPWVPHIVLSMNTTNAFLSRSWPVKSLLLWENQCFQSQLKSCTHNSNIVASVHHSVPCSSLYNHLYTQFIVNVTFRIIDYTWSLGETLKMNFLSLLATYSLICQRENSGALAHLGPLWSLILWVHFGLQRKKIQE